jgi:hypothetical protein
MHARHETRATRPVVTRSSLALTMPHHVSSSLTWLTVRAAGGGRASRWARGRFLPRFPLVSLMALRTALALLEARTILRKILLKRESATCNPGLQCTAIPNLPINTVKSSPLRMRTAFRFLGSPPLASGHISKQWWATCFHKYRQETG